MVTVSFVARIKVSEREGKKGSTKFCRIMIQREALEALDLKNGELVQVYMGRIRKEKVR